MDWNVCISFFQIFALLSPRDSERFIWNRFVNNSGKRGRNIPRDEDTEHSNNSIKQHTKNLGLNVTEKAVQRLSYSENSTSMTMGNLDDNIKRLLRSGKHSSASLEKDLHELVKGAIESKIFPTDRLSNLDVSCLYKWINKHKKNILSGIRAR